MHPEIRNLANLAKHAARSLARGRLGEAGAAIVVVGIRIVEAAAEVVPSAAVRCDFCGWSGRRFKTFLAGRSRRRGAVCPRCLSLERHREFIRLFRRLRPLFGERIRILDIGPTLAFSTICRGSPDVHYVSLDKSSALAMVRGDLHHLPVRPGAFDVVLCSHVLDYLVDDRKGMREIRSALKEDGVAILEHTFRRDCPTEEWQAPRRDALDRRRQYGADLPDRLRDAGLEVRAAGPGTEVFLAFKPTAGARITAVERAVAS